MDYAEAKRRIGDHAPTENSWLLLPTPLATPFSALGREALYTLKLAHNHGRVSKILAISQLPEEDTYHGLVSLIEFRYLYQAFIALKFVEGPYQGRRDRFPPQPEMVMGRDPDADVVMVDERTSRRHARLVQAGVQLTVEDLGSRNGTYVNGELIASATPLMDGDRVLVGNSVVEVGLDYVGYDPRSVSTAELMAPLSIDIDLDINVDTVTIGSAAGLIAEGVSVDDLEVHLAITHPLTVPLDILTSAQLDVLQLAHNFNHVEAILMNAPATAIQETLRHLHALEAQGYLQRLPTPT